MSQVTYRANLSAKSFPFLARNWGRSVIVPQYDNTFNRQITSDSDSDKDVGIPQVYYCHNVMPHQQGFQSIGYTTLSSGGAPYSKKIFLARDGSGNAIYLLIDTTGKIYRQSGASWTYLQTFPSAAITYAYVSGVTYIYVANYKCYRYDFTSAALVEVTLTGLDLTKILGITYSGGYLIAWSTDAVAWSSTIEATSSAVDFTPSLTTGAGGGSVESARGSIVTCLAQNLGFIIYTTNNAVAALSSGNARYPFNFREIVASGGLVSSSQIASDANTGNQYAYTTSGLQLVSASQTQTILPELTDFVAGKLFEDYDEGSDEIYTVSLTATMQKAIALVADKYLVISYGIESLTHALVYDLIDRRWGKLKIPHVQCFDYELPAGVVTETPRQSIAFLQSDGSIKLLDFSVTSSASSGVICLGKYQFVRQRLLQLDEINAENIQPGANLSLHVLSSLDGKNASKTTPVLSYSSSLFRRYNCRVTGINHSLVFRGAFSLVSLELVFNVHGKR